MAPDVELHHVNGPDLRRYHREIGTAFPAFLQRRLPARYRVRHSVRRLFACLARRLSYVATASKHRSRVPLFIREVIVNMHPGSARYPGLEVLLGMVKDPGR